ncbi:MAG: conserved phage C-terminal domain-containing protein, partial [Clostridiales bacterium]|nr:conserved phage C-terminal domain-containing protein [Clostridiales bacterium]
DTNTESVPDAGLLSFDLIQYLNEKTGSDYKADLSNAKRVQSLLDAGYSPDQLRTVIDKKVSEWMTDEKMRPYLRPSTLFGDKFGEYLAAPISIAAERERDQKKKQSDLNRELEDKRRALAYMKDSLKEATKEERRNLREQIAILEDSIGLIERRLT